MFAKIRRGATGLAIAAVLTGGATAMSAAPATASPAGSGDVITGPFDISNQCWQDAAGVVAGDRRSPEHLIVRICPHCTHVHEIVTMPG